MFILALIVSVSFWIGLVSSTQSVRVIRVADKEPDPNRTIHTYGSKQATNVWLHKKWEACQEYNKEYKPENKCSVLAYYQNNPIDQSPSNPFYNSFVNAYNYHKDVVLAPDDVWTMICLQFSQYVNRYAEQLRSQLVYHRGKMELTVITDNERSESQWDEFLLLVT